MKYAVGNCAISQRFGGRFFWHFFWHLNLQGWSTVNRQMAAWSSWLLFVLLHFSKYIKILMFAFMCTLYTVQLYRKPNKYTKIQIRGWWWGKGLVAMSSMPLNLQSSSTFGLNVCVFSRWWEPGHHWFSLQSTNCEEHEDFLFLPESIFLFDELVLVSLSYKLTKDRRENWICPIWPQLLTWKYGEYTGGWRPSLPGLGSSWENWWKKFPRFQGFEIGYWKQKQSQMFKGEVLEFNSKSDCYKLSLPSRTPSKDQVQTCFLHRTITVWQHNL